ncbi:MAG: Rieske 2Fe-2S domain-containing protein [Rhizobiales bacterium]|nr:Rieske 2Fe-2S domain-containing protein [Hyphomicrobiales bacterium]
MTVSEAQKKPRAKHVVATVGEIPPGGHKLVELQGRQIGVFNVKGEFLAISNRCPHQGGSLCHGKLVGLAESEEPGQYKLSRHGELLRCPWHGWEFDIRTGQSWCDPTRVRVRSYAVSVEPGESLVKGPYVAETFDVSVEEDYVLVAL